MSSSATITLDEPAHDLAEFFAKHEIVHSPKTVGGNVYYQHGDIGGVEVTAAAYGCSGMQITFSHFFMGDRLHDVARLALAAWKHWGGALEASPEIVNIIASGAAS